MDIQVWNHRNTPILHFNINKTQKDDMLNYYINHPGFQEYLLIISDEKVLFNRGFTKSSAEGRTGGDINVNR